MNVVVIGGSSSVGKTVVAVLREAGHDVLSTGRSDLDVTSFGSVSYFANRSVVSPVDVLVVLVGVCPGKNFVEYAFDGEVDDVVGTNFTGPVNVVRALLPLMRDGGHVLLMSSVSGLRGSYDPVYAASKAALIGFVRSFAAHPVKVRVNALAPDLIESSSMYLAMGEERREHHRKNSPTGRLTTLADVAAAIVDSIGKPVNGQVIRIEGGGVRVEA